MPPRIPGPQGLRGLTLCLRPAPTPAFQPLVQTANLSRKEKIRKMKQDPYAWAQAQQRKAASVSRRKELEAQRDAGWGSPIHGIPTPFVESFDTAGQAPLSTPLVDKHGNPLEEPHPLPTTPQLRNYLLSEEEVEKAIEQARNLTKPLTDPTGLTGDPVKEAEELEIHEAKHKKAVLAIQRIADLANGNAKDRKHANIRRCIETFGRHNTDLSLENPQPPLSRGVVPQPQVPRAGPDTGSSEVQIAILTAKIRALAHALDSQRGNKDKVNKRNLRKLCHKRQRLLRYMEKKERGSGRWQHMLETLGLSPATWKEQISF
ncbi:ribosomal protein [Cercophora newfieldiana]|uniref:Ribosomal protein n=1 Tax=Cercophora newfieldiana TaxID=92897 RepID=A0AA39YFE6_9PEZI|nr:ribosomal protein [Cercophora newfieldiana]